MATLPAKPTMKDRILETADRLFYLQGIRAIGVDTIAAEIGISKRTLYNHFPSKDALIAAYLERRFVAPRPSDKPPAEQILGTFDVLERRFAGKTFAAARSSTRSPNSAPKTTRCGKSRSNSRKAAGCGFAISVQLGVTDAEALATQLRSWSTAASPRTWCATTPPWPARPRKSQKCC